jgi:class 3 adenylate cyclase
MLRLLRILKLYKSVLFAREAKARLSQVGKRNNRLSHIGDSDDMGVDDFGNESLVGKRLSELTTRHVICLVLVMMLVLPLLQIDESVQYPTSAVYGADIVFGSFQQMLDAGGSIPDRRTYETSLLHYIFYHNWFASSLDSCPYERACPLDFSSQLFWVGVVGSNEEMVHATALHAALQNRSLIQQMASKAAQVQSTESSSWLYNYGNLRSDALNVMGAGWDADCSTETGSTSYTRLGFSLLLGLGSGAPRCPHDLRRVEWMHYAPGLNLDIAAYKTWHLAFYFDLRPFVASESANSLLVTFFVCVALGSAALLFSQDADSLVLHPLETMMSKVESIRKNPLAAMKMEEAAFKEEELKKTRHRNSHSTVLQSFWDMATCARRQTTKEPMETLLLEKTIIKLGSLLAVGFGEAGTSIIALNMRGIDSACVHAVVEGTRLNCVIGVLRIRHFSTAMEVLQTNVMAFVNCIAEIVHGIVHDFHGAANRNNGDTFLAIWREKDRDKANVQKLADMAMLAFVKILAAVNRSRVLAQYRSHPGLQQRLGKGNRVSISGGLHFGWAIEGAVGTEFKIDASYLSPNVSIAESVELATKIYRVNILVAESILRICSSALASQCRLVDRVVITGSAEPMELYVIDLDCAALSIEPAPKVQMQWTPQVRFRLRQFLGHEKARLWDNVRISSLFDSNMEIIAMRRRYTKPFFHIFNMGYQNYVLGEWQVAQRLLLQTMVMLGINDGPSTALLRFMEHPYQFEAPTSWRGVRSLDEATLAEASIDVFEASCTQCHQVKPSDAPACASPRACMLERVS